MNCLKSKQGQRALSLIVPPTVTETIIRGSGCFTVISSGRRASLS